MEEPFSYIPEGLRPKEEEHVKYDNVFRAIESKCPKKEDFIPSIFEKHHRKEVFLDREPQQGLYSVSLNTNPDNLKYLYKTSVGFRKHHKAIAKGFTDINKGISTKENKEGHIDYYLYDYENNSPYADFEFYEEMSK